MHWERKYCLSNPQYICVLSRPVWRLKEDVLRIKNRCKIWTTYLTKGRYWATQWFVWWTIQLSARSKLILLSGIFVLSNKRGGSAWATMICLMNNTIVCLLLQCKIYLENCSHKTMQMYNDFLMMDAHWALPNENVLWPWIKRIILWIIICNTIKYV